MQLLIKLFYYYYWHQVRIGNKDVAPFFAILSIVFALILYYFSAVILVAPYFPNGIDIREFILKSGIVIFVTLLIIFYFVFIHNKKYKKIIENTQVKGRLIAVIFPLIAFVLLNIGWVLIVIHNRGS